MKKKLLFVLTALLTSTVSAWADVWQDPETKVNYEYTVGESEASVKAGSWHFAGSPDVTGSVTILSSFIVGGNEYYVESIGVCAFDGCSGLTSITIPNSVTSIEHRAFAGCSGLTSIKVESGNTVYDSREDCNAIIKTETNMLIAGCQNTVIPNSVKSIGNSAFYLCTGLTTVTIPNSVTGIGEEAFSYCEGLTSITIPNSVTSIVYRAFEGCTSLTSVMIGNSVTSIGEYAFAWCSGLTSITIPNSVMSIGDDAFYGCRGLTSVISLKEDPFEIDDDCFPTTIATLYVPVSTKEKYEATNGWKSFTKIVEFGDASITLAKDMETFTYGMALDFSTAISGLKAYIVKEVKDGKAVLSEVKGIVPPATGLVLKGTAGQSYTIPYSTSTPVVENKLVGVLIDTEIGGNNKDYILQDGKFVKANWGTLKAGKAYLKLDAALAREVIEIDGEVTGISTVNGEGVMVDGYYNLNGQRISQPTKGLYIKNGKKHMVN